MYIIFAGPFSTAPLEEAGFHCPKLELALRNPLKIAKFAHAVIQDGAKNLLDYGVLRSSIDTSNSLNIAEGQLIKVEKNNLVVSFCFSLKAFQLFQHTDKGDQYWNNSVEDY